MPFGGRRRGYVTSAGGSTRPVDDKLIESVTEALKVAASPEDGVRRQLWARFNGECLTFNVMPRLPGPLSSLEGDYTRMALVVGAAGTASRQNFERFGVAVHRERGVRL